MNVPPGKQPATWQDYDSGRHSSVDSDRTESHVQWEDGSQPDLSRQSSQPRDGHDEESNRLRRR